MSDTHLGSTYLTSSIQTIADLVYRTKTLLGYPIVTDEMTDAMWLK